jgi:hypothetical protein
LAGLTLADLERSDFEVAVLADHAAQLATAACLQSFTALTVEVGSTRAPVQHCALPRHWDASPVAQQA